MLSVNGLSEASSRVGNETIKILHQQQLPSPFTLGVTLCNLVYILWAILEKFHLAFAQCNGVITLSENESDNYK